MANQWSHNFIALSFVNQLLNIQVKLILVKLIPKHLLRRNPPLMSSSRETNPSRHLLKSPAAAMVTKRSNAQVRQAANDQTSRVAILQGVSFTGNLDFGRFPCWSRCSSYLLPKQDGGPGYHFINPIQVTPCIVGSDAQAESLSFGWFEYLSMSPYEVKGK